jgi:hypothetical protein
MINVMNRAGKMRFRLLLAGVVAAIALAPVSQAREWKTYESKKFGYSLKIPAEFTIQSEDTTTSWIFQPGSAPAAEKPADQPAEKKKKSLGAKLKGIAQDAATGGAAESGGTTGGGLESALSIHVTWTWMPDVAPETLYKANMDSVKQDISSPAPKYADPQVFSKKAGYAYEGNAFWYKEVAKTKPDEIHRWLIGAYGNKSNYGVILGGVQGQFEEWGPVFEEIVKSFKLIPIEKQ